MLEKPLLVVVLLLLATNLWALPMDVSTGRHNMSTSATEAYYRSGNEDEICIFCHTPHGGSLNGPLWNRAYTPAATGFTHYSSATLSGYMTGVAIRDVNMESLLCMSCHDGSVTTGAINNIINSSNRTGALPSNLSDPMAPSWFGPGAVIGDIGTGTGFGTLGHTKNLSDDHPVSFSYYSAWNHADNSGKLNRGDNTAEDPRLKGIRFFGPDQMGEQRVECSSCHDPHVDFSAAGDPNLAPFLVMSNAGSALCLACHVK